MPDMQIVYWDGLYPFLAFHITYIYIYIYIYIYTHVFVWLYWQCTYIHMSVCVCMRESGCLHLQSLEYVFCTLGGTHISLHILSYISYTFIHIYIYIYTIFFLVVYNTIHMLIDVSLILGRLALICGHTYTNTNVHTNICFYKKRNIYEMCIYRYVCVCVCVCVCVSM